MRVAVIGSRSLKVGVEKYIPEGTTEIISGGARGIDSLAEKWADSNRIPKLIIKPDYGRYRESASLFRDRAIAEIADIVVAIWDGKSPGTRYTIDYARSIGKPVRVYIL
jgi:hypothetical protein